VAGNSVESGRFVTSKVTAILLTFTEGNEHTLTEISRRAGLPISTAHRLMTELADRQMLVRLDDGVYRAGAAMRTFRAVDGSVPSLAERAPCVLEDLSAVTKCRTRLGVLHGGFQVSYIEKSPGADPTTAFTPDPPIDVGVVVA
jgi:DNA-binding IclR family transcriptional regulator